MPTRLNSGARVEWTYWRSGHCTKRGTFLKYVKHYNSYHGARLALVQFDGNKTLRRVNVRNLKEIKTC